MRNSWRSASATLCSCVACRERRWRLLNTVQMRISAKTDYAIRAVIEMAAAGGDGRLVKAEAVAEAQEIPLRFLLSILNELRHAGIVDSRRGADGGYRLAKPA